MNLKDYSKDKLNEIVKNSHSYNDVLRKLGYSTTSGRNHWTIKNRISELGIDTTHFSFVKGKRRTDEELFVENSDASNSVVRKRYKKGNYSEYKCAICGQDAFWNGKPLTLILDHQNGDNTDNRLENLHWVCPNCNSQLGTTGFCGIRKYDSYGNKLEHPIAITKPNYCVDCGKKITRKATRCNNCQNKFLRRTKTKDLPISREELKNKIRAESFTQIGKEFNVTDNSIKKWCKKLGLPYKKQIIKSYSNEEWAKI